MFLCLTPFMVKRFESLLLKLMPVLLSPCHEGSLSIFSMTLPIASKGAADPSTVPPKQALVQAEHALVSHSLLSEPVLQILPSQRPSGELAPVYSRSSRIGETKTRMVFRHGLKSTEEGKDNPFFSSTSCGPVVTAQKAVALCCLGSSSAHCPPGLPEPFLQSISHKLCCFLCFSIPSPLHCISDSKDTEQNL